MTTSNLRAAVVRGLAWQSAGRGGAQIVTWLSTFVLIRLLDPSDFGTMALVMISIAYAEYAMEAGLGAAIVRTADIGPAALRAVFWLTLILAVLLSSALVLLAQELAEFFSNPVAARALRVSAIGIPLTSLIVVPRALLLRATDFRAISMMQFRSAVATAAVSLILAFANWGVWALIYGWLAGLAVRVTEVWLRAPVPLWGMPSVKAASQLLRFGAWVASDQFLWTLYRTADSLIVARLFGSVTLGFYATGQNLASIARRRMAPLFTTVSYPILSRLIDEPERFTRYVLGLSRAASLFAFPLCAGLTLTAADFVPLFFTEKWLGAILPIQVLALVAAVQLQGNLLVPAVRALGRPAWNTALTAATALALPVALWGAATLTNGVGGVLAVVAAVYPLLTAARVCILRTLVGLRVSGYLAALAPAGVSSLVMMAIVVGAQVLLGSALPVVRLSASVVVGVGSYGLMLGVAFPGVLREARGVLRELRG